MYKVLFSAFSCLPDRGSEPGVGWNWALQAARNVDIDVTVLTRTKCRTKIEPALRELGLNNLHFLYVPSSPRLREKSIYLEYLFWQRAAYLYVKRNYSAEDFDIFWHITFGSVFLPIWTHKLPYDFVWGPMGGGEHILPSFYQALPFKASLTHRLKYALVKTAYMNPFVQGPAKKASLILARTNETKSLLRKRYRAKTKITLETRMDSSSIPATCWNVRPYNDGRLHLCYTGRLIALKNVDRLLAAISILLDEGLPLTLHVVGEGPLRQSMEKKYERHVRAGFLIFHGHMDRESALQLVSACPVFVFPSLREGGSWSLMEAMVLGRAIVCFDASGMHEMLDSSSALLLPMMAPSEVAQQFEYAIRRLAEDPDLIESLGSAARERAARKFCWSEARDCVHEVVRIVRSR